jgi:hypothetical protein
MPYYFFAELEDGKTVRRSQEYDNLDQLVIEDLPEVLEAFQKAYGETEDGVLQEIYEMLNEATAEGDPLLIYDMQSWCGEGANVKLYPDVDRIYIVKI